MITDYRKTTTRKLSFFSRRQSFKLAGTTTTADDEICATSNTSKTSSPFLNELLAASFVLAPSEKKNFSINASKASAVEFSRRFDLVLVGAENKSVCEKKASKNIFKGSSRGCKKSVQYD